MSAVETTVSKTRKKAEPKPRAFIDHSVIPVGTLVRKSVVMSAASLSPTSLWRAMDNGQFPKPRQVCNGRPLWLIDDIRAYARGEWKGEAA